MKIHIHTPSYFPDLVGMTYAAHVHASILTKIGAEVTIVAPIAGNSELGERVEYDVRRFAVQGSGLPWNRLRGDVDGLLRFTGKAEPDLIIIEGWFTVGAALIDRLKPFAKHVVLASHGSADLSLSWSSPAQLARSFAYRWDEWTRSKAIIQSLSAALVLSDYMDAYRFRDVRWFRDAGLPTYICPNISTYVPSNGHRIGCERIDIIHIGEMKPHKNQKEAVRSVSELSDNFHLTLVFPQETDYLNEVVSLAREVNMQDRLHFVIGHKRSDLESIVENSDILLITSPSKDVQPIVAVDALAKGVPFVSTDVGCMRNFGGGLVVASIREISAAIKQLCDNYENFRNDAKEYSNVMLSPQIAENSLRKMLNDLEFLI